MPTDEITIDDLVNWYCEYYGIELWKDIPGYEGDYMVSNLGRIKSLKYGRETILRQNTNRDNRPSISLSKHSVVKRIMVHRLVGQAFVPNPYNYPQINHIDENPTNNVAANLEWCDCQYNNNYGNHPKNISIRMSGETNPMYGIRGGDSPSAVPVISTRIDTGEVEYWASITDFFIANGLKPYPGNISKVCSGKTKTAYGRTWKYV